MKTENFPLIAINSVNSLIGLLVQLLEKNARYEMSTHPEPQFSPFRTQQATEPKSAKAEEKEAAGSILVFYVDNCTASSRLWQLNVKKCSFTSMRVRKIVKSEY